MKARLCFPLKLLLQQHCHSHVAALYQGNASICYEVKQIRDLIDLPCPCPILALGWLPWTVGTYGQSPETPPRIQDIIRAEQNAAFHGQQGKPFHEQRGKLQTQCPCWELSVCKHRDGSTLSSQGEGSLMHSSGVHRPPFEINQCQGSSLLHGASSGIDEVVRVEALLWCVPAVLHADLRHTAVPTAGLRIRLHSSQQTRE